MRYAFYALAALTLTLALYLPASRAQETRPTTSTPAAATQPAAASVETVVILRHGEKPPGGQGQLTPQGLNRALALSTVLPQKFGKPDYLFAPDPRQKVSDAAGLCNYVRPLATIEPIAIKFEMPVQTPCGFRDVAELEEELAKPHYANATVFVVWEHVYARQAAADLVKTFGGGDGSNVPAWPGHDFDSLYVVKITRVPGRPPAVTFTHDHEGLDGQSTEMPLPASKSP